MAKIAFKNDNQKQFLLLPPSLDELIPATHPVRVVNTVIDTLNVDNLLSSYRGGGNSCFHPRQMLKILVYAYLNNIYSSRRIEQCLEENIHYMWLGGGIKPDHRTINYFRGKRLKGCFDTLFTQIVELLHREGFVSLHVQYIDGTKIESAANKYSFVWRGSVEKYDARLREKTDAVLREIEHVIEAENSDAMEDNTLSTEEFSSRVERIKEHMQQGGMTKQKRKQIKELDSAIEKMSEYDQLSPAEKAARRKQANILCFISLGLHFIPEMISGMLTGIVDSISKTADIGSTSEVLSIIISVLFGGSYVASWVLMIVARVKYKESRFAKILMWVYIGILAAGIIAVILVIAMCAYILKDCHGF